MYVLQKEIHEIIDFLFVSWNGSPGYIVQTWVLCGWLAPFSQDILRVYYFDQGWHVSNRISYLIYDFIWASIFLIDNSLTLTGIWWDLLR